MLKNVLLPKLVSLNSLNFDFLECSFDDRMMTVKDKKDGLSREGCGRVSIMRAAEGLPNCYTLECNYATGRTINHLSQKLDLATGQIEPESAMTNPKSQIYVEAQAKDPKKQKAPVYTIEIFQDIGRAFLIGLLDFYQINPVSRIPTSIYKTVEGVKEDILARFPIFIPKKKEDPDQPSTLARKSTAKVLIRQTTAKVTTKSRIHSFSVGGRTGPQLKKVDQPLAQILKV